MLQAPHHQRLPRAAVPRVLRRPPGAVRGLRSRVMSTYDVAVRPIDSREGTITLEARTAAEAAQAAAFVFKTLFGRHHLVECWPRKRF